jgi:phage baseplate assembly protein W
MAFPYRFDARGRTASADDAAHVRDLIEQVLFTRPGERTMRPDFGTGLMQLVFAPASGDLASATQVLVESALQQWLGHRIDLGAVAVEVGEGALEVRVDYRLRASGEDVSDRFAVAVPS